ncbi:DNA polymerase IV [Motiliproteus sp. SC1-56]|uniref:DNA polymerase IV n=1 Tax=Motiliproteus sp. SC1-56 TaxID=2799565 RepID=UPI001A8E9D78|nr:DNA polymerase IV [Motiliproteus sp. SC1-56]
MSPLHLSPSAGRQRKIIHCDCDCFYAAIEMRDDPALRGIPIAVGGAPDKRGVISTCNYEARAFGVRSAMASARAVTICPGLRILPPRFEAYREASAQISAIFADYTEFIEPLSLDEAYLDVTDCHACQGSATLIAEEIRQRVRAQVGITISAGVAPNKFLAKVASDWNKPDGLCVITPDQVPEFVERLPVSRLHGVGPATAARLKARGIETCGDVRPYRVLELSQWLGRFGERLYQLCRGIDERPVKTSWRRKSVSVENTYPHDLPDLASCEARLPALLESLERRLGRLDSSYRVVGALVKVKFDDFTQTTVEQRSLTPDAALYRRLLGEGVARGERPVRLLGVGVRLEDLAEAAPTAGQLRQLSLDL